MTQMAQPEDQVLNDAPMAVLPLNSSSKLDQEPNPFEQSFSGVTATTKPVLPPVSSITSPAPLQHEVNTLRTGPLSPSMLPGPNKHHHQYRESTEQQEQSAPSTKRTTKKKSAKHIEDDEKRKNFLERNRIAALKCRQRKKQWLNNLQSKVELLTNENEQLQTQVDSMREEIVNLKTLLLAHKDCPLAQQTKMMGNHHHSRVTGAPSSGATMAASGVYHPQMPAASFSQPPNTMMPASTGVIRF
ncbi:hypothetical protein K492DRAFT_57953 [Lichtheimia hyalospora FSU 10163]|nr:hypothetical protein K492DRAFT_57953 [Lichtheimia hyalospora FSU 10163]